MGSACDAFNTGKPTVRPIVKLSSKFDRPSYVIHELDTSQLRRWSMMDSLLCNYSSPDREEIELEGIYTVQTPASTSSWILSKLFVLDCLIQWRHTTPRPSYYRWDIFSTMLLTLNFDLDLCKVDSDIWQRRLTYVISLVKIGLSLFEKIITKCATNEQTNQPTT